MARERGYFEYPDGLTPGRSKDGGWSQLLYNGDGDLVDHGTFFPEEHEDDAGGDEATPGSPDWVIPAAIWIAVSAVATVVAVKAAPPVKKWWNEDALPAIRAKWKGFGKASEAHNQAATTEIIPLSGASSASFSEEVDDALEEHQASMSSKEAQQRLLAILMAAAFIAEQLRRLSNARVEVEVGLPELDSAMEKLTAQQVTASINLMLEANASLIDEETSEQFMTIFGGGRFVEGQYVALRNEKIKDALRLTDGAV